MTNRFKGLDLVDRVPEELWTEVHNIVQKVVTKTIAKKKKSVQFSQSFPTLYNPMNHSMPGLPVHHQLQKFTQTHVH